MDIDQRQVFAPVIITLETREEADAFFAMLTMDHTRERNDPAERLKIELANWFSNNYH